MIDFTGQVGARPSWSTISGQPCEETGRTPRWSTRSPAPVDRPSPPTTRSTPQRAYPQFCGQYFARAKDKDLGLAVLRAYNDWHIDEWCGTYPGRMIPQALPPIWDPQLMADEVRRVTGKSCHAVTFSENPTKIGYPSLHDPHWDPYLDMVTWECDYPHSDSTWPLAPETLPIYLDGLPDDEINKITHENAMRLYSFDMFSHHPKEALTVGALCAQATDVDLGFRSSERLKKTGTDTVTVLDLAAKLPT